MQHPMRTTPSSSPSTTTLYRAGRVHSPCDPQATALLVTGHPDGDPNGDPDGTPPGGPARAPAGGAAGDPDL